MRITIAQILDEMKKVVEEGRIESPGWWIDNAIKLAVLRQDLQAQMVKAEISYRNEVVEEIIRIAKKRATLNEFET